MLNLQVWSEDVGKQYIYIFDAYFVYLHFKTKGINQQGLSGVKCGNETITNSRDVHQDCLC